MVMKIAILGGGFTGLAAAYDLSQKGHEVTLFEKEKVLGGLAVGFKGENWDWYLERAYHHLLDSENEMLEFARDIGFDRIFFKETSTGSLYKVKKILRRASLSQDDSANAGADYRIFPVDSPQDFLRFPLLSLPQKIRAGLVIAGLKLSPFLKTYEKQTAQEFLTKTMGKEVWEIFWSELFRKKFGKYAGNILATFIWARIKKRAKKLGYIEGGFQTLIDYVEAELIKLKVKIYKGVAVESVVKRGEKLAVKSGEEELFDAIISTLPTPVLTKITPHLFPAQLTRNLRKLEYLHAVVLIIESQKPLLDKTYWLNICTPDLPMMLIAQHTNFIDKKHYAGHHIAYVAWYVDGESKLLKMDKEQILQYIKPHLKKISNFQFPISNTFLFKAPWAQPVFDHKFVKNMPHFITPIKNFYIANLDMTYPFDRGTNYAVKLGREVAKMI